MGNILKKCRRKNDDPEVEERRLAISRTIASRIAATRTLPLSRIAATGGTLPLRRRHLTAAIETFIAGKKFIDNYWFLIRNPKKFSEKETDKKFKFIKRNLIEKVNTRPDIDYKISDFIYHLMLLKSPASYCNNTF